jgi:hypothetical protein
MTATPALSSEAAMVLGLAGTAMPFARSREEQAERWLRVLRLHGDVSAPLQAVGIGELPIMEAEPPAAEPQPAAGDDGRTDAPDAKGAHARVGAASEGETVRTITDLATRSAERRGAATVATVDVLVGAMDFYGESFDRILRAYGTDRDEVLERALASAA